MFSTTTQGQAPTFVGFCDRAWDFLYIQALHRSLYITQLNHRDQNALSVIKTPDSPSDISVQHGFYSDCVLVL